jgi:hypothetical protein
MSIFTDEKNKKEFARIFREKTMSGSISDERAIEIIIRDNPHFFRVPTPDDIAKVSRSELNSEIRRRAGAGLQSSKLADRIFNNIPPTDKKPA